MEIRKLTKEEIIQHDGICQMVFFGNNRDITTALKNPAAYEDDDAKTIRIGAVDGAGIVQSALIIEAYDMRLNGKTVKMGGIGGVTTRPESRGRGLVKQLMIEAYKIMKKEDIPFSFLYPFDYDYYRYFGYELCMSYHKFDIPLDLFSKYSYPKNIKAYQVGDDFSDIKHIYHDFTKDKNLAIVRDDAAWYLLLKRDAYKDYQFSYVIYNTENHPHAYILYNMEKGTHHWEKHIKVKECAWVDVIGFHDLAGFLSKLTTEFTNIKIEMPANMNMHAMFSDPYRINKSENSGGMGRLNNVRACLSGLNVPMGFGSVTIAVTDAFLTENSGVYAVEWQDGVLHVHHDCIMAENAVTACDMVLDVHALTQLVVGYLSIDEIMYQKNVCINQNHALLNQLFPKKIQFLTEKF